MKRVFSGRALVAALVACLLVPAGASAHATVSSTSPQRGQVVATAPAQVVFTFDESVSAAPGAIRVFDKNGKRVDSGTSFHPGGVGKQVGVKLTSGLGNGGYTATYHVISADSHPVSGGFVFGIGTGGGVNQTVDQLLQGQTAGPVTATAFSIARGVQFLSIAIGLGTLLFILLCWLPGLRAVSGSGGEWAEAAAAFDVRARRMIGFAAIGGVVSGVVALAGERAQEEGATIFASLKPAALSDVLSTRFGTVWGLGILVWLLVGTLVFARVATVPRLQPASVGATGLALPDARRPGLIAVGALLGLMALEPALAGHATTQDPTWLFTPMNVIHVLSMAAWVGGVAVLLFGLRAATGKLAGPDRTRLLAAAVGRFSAVAFYAVIAIVLTGIVESLIEVRSPGRLLDTAMGRSVLIKSILLCVLVCFGYVNRFKTVPKIKAAAASGSTPGAAGVLLRNTLRAEGLLLVAVLGVTGALASYPPSSTVGTGPVDVNTIIGPARLELTVDPARTGPNVIHLYLFDRKSGAQFDAAKEVDVSATLASKQIGPLKLDPIKSGPGHYTITGAPLSPAGKWKIAVSARVSDFDEYSGSVSVPVK